MSNPNHRPDLPRCGAKTRAGGSCVNPPMTGGVRCHKHGGSSPQAKAKATERAQQAEAHRAVELFAARRDIEPGAALLELVQWTAGEVDYWRGRVRELDENALTWGVTRVRNSSVTTVDDDTGSESLPGRESTSEAKPNIAYVMLVDAQNRLATYAVAALRAGVAERAIRISEQQGAIVVEALRAVLAAMFAVIIDVLRAHGVGDAVIVNALRVAWADAMGVIVPREFRRLTEGPS